MGALTEREIFDRLTCSFKAAAEACEDLAKLPRKGPTYVRLRAELRLIEGCCRQASAWREDTRWLQIGLQMAEAHKRAGDWLRGIKLPSGVRVKLAEGQIHPLFKTLSEHLRSCERIAIQYRDSATGRLGMILPRALPAPHRDTRPVGFRRSSGGIILPSGVTLQ